MEIQKLSKDVEQTAKPTYPIKSLNDDNDNENNDVDADHELTFQQFGPAIKYTSPIDGAITYKPVKQGMEIDLEKAKAGEYSLTDLLAFEKEDLGEYRGNSLKLRTGKYGAYLEFGTVKQSIRDIGVPLENVDYAKAVEFLDSILKTSTMKVPKFLALKKFPHKYDTCDLAVLEKWVKSFD